MSVAKISLHCISKLLVNKWFNRIFKLHVLYGTQKKLGKKPGIQERETECGERGE